VNRSSAFHQDFGCRWLQGVQGEDGGRDKTAAVYRWHWEDLRSEISANYSTWNKRRSEIQWNPIILFSTWVSYECFLLAASPPRGHGMCNRNLKHILTHVPNCIPSTLRINMPNVQRLVQYNIVLRSWLKSHLLAEVASWLAPAAQNTVLLKSCDLIFVLNHTWLPFYQRAISLFPWLTYSSIVDFFPRVGFLPQIAKLFGLIFQV